MPHLERKPISSREQHQTSSPPLSLDEIRDKRWTRAAIEGELEKIPNYIASEKIYKAESPFFASLIKIASVVKGSGSTHLSPDQALDAIKDASSEYKWLHEKEIERQWKNAFKLAEPRFRPKAGS